MYSPFGISYCKIWYNAIVFNESILTNSRLYFIFTFEGRDINRKHYIVCPRAAGWRQRKYPLTIIMVLLLDAVGYYTVPVSIMSYTPMGIVYVRPIILRIYILTPAPTPSSNLSRRCCSANGLWRTFQWAPNTLYFLGGLALYVMHILSRLESWKRWGNCPGKNPNKERLRVRPISWLSLSFFFWRTVRVGHVGWSCSLLSCCCCIVLLCMHCWNFLRWLSD